jgi:isopentenyldiphosphate isomerase
LGITDFQPESLGHYVYESDREKELVYVHRCIYDGEIHPSEEELEGGRFFSTDEIKQNIGKGVFTPNFENEYTKYFL